MSPSPGWRITKQSSSQITCHWLTHCSTFLYLPLPEALKNIRLNKEQHYYMQLQYPEKSSIQQYTFTITNTDQCQRTVGDTTESRFKPTSKQWPCPCPLLTNNAIAQNNMWCCVPLWTGWLLEHSPWDQISKNRHRAGYFTTQLTWWSSRTQFVHRHLPKAVFS